MTEMNETELPKPSVPELSVTLNRFLEGIRAIVPGDKYEEARRLVEDYKKSEEMQKLQEFLKEYAESHENYVTEFWLKETLKNPLPLPINSSPFFLLPKRIFNTDDERFRFIARFILFSLNFNKRVDRCELKHEFAGGQEKKNALSMATYRHFFTAYRRPGAIKDEHIFSEGGRYFIVVCNNQLFQVKVTPFIDSNPSENVLIKELKKIEALSKQVPHYPPVGILTALNRKEWARIREQMIEDDNNKESIRIIENCLFVVCMDESIEDLRKDTKSKSYYFEDLAHHIIHGKKSEHSTGNRWFDKFIQFIVTKNGVNGIVIERSVSEGIEVLKFCEEFLDFVKNDTQLSVIRHSDDNRTAVRRLKWNISESLAEEIKNASAVTDAMIDTLELNVFSFIDYGKRFSEKHEINPDVFILLSLQLTYFRTHGKVTATYESGALRKFRFGRVDNIRASSQEALEFSKSVLDPSLSQAEKWEKFQKAVKKQTEILLYTINGEGPDNHLLCLKEMAALHGLEEPALYQTDYYKEFLNFRLSTSQLPTTYDIVVGYGPVVPDGYGCSYNPQENRIVFCISSFKNASTDSEKFAQNLHVSLIELKELCESGKTAVSTSSPTKAAVKAEAKK
ncbi:choline O-acetyltransferase-like [Centruroides sculpturatus]|uniref:choline O-acetyltransferase-like n=1 Tax=Centruroides sculpturatus TaxID=218467 RepID=UPI000C6CCC16|nr:choline O-acetyltransferase-like [Centruroides sculpturatus]